MGGQRGCARGMAFSLSLEVSEGMLQLTQHVEPKHTQIHTSVCLYVCIKVGASVCEEVSV
jgi:hypothetical protein